MERCLLLSLCILLPGLGAELCDGPTGVSLPPLLRGLRYEAHDQNGVAFRTGAARRERDGLLRFELAGPAAGEADVTARLTPLPHGGTIVFTITLRGPARRWNIWSSGFRFDFGDTVTSALAPPAVVKWRQPGALPDEVPGDALVPDLELQLREVLFGDQALVIASPRYDPDWFYEGDLKRVSRARFVPPAEPGEATYALSFLALPTAELDSARLAAEVAGRPLAMRVGTGRLGNLSAPAEPAELRIDLDNLAAGPQQASLTLDAWSYQGERLLAKVRAVDLPAGGRTRLTETVVPRRRGVVFVTAKLAWPGGEQVHRLTLGVLPERRAEGLRPDSPFALAAIIGSPQRYPDQYPLETTLPLAERIGVRWVRTSASLLAAEPDPAAIKAVSERAALYARHGLLGYLHPGASVPAPEGVEALQARIASTVRHLDWGNPYLEVGNELNFSTRPGDYVARLLRPEAEAVRRTRPDIKIMSMGLGGVDKAWLAGFEEAGGMDLIDVLSIHPGCHPRAPEFYQNYDGWVFRPQLRDALRVARAHGKPVWLDEAYAPTPPRRGQVDVRTAADYLVRTHVCALALGVERIAWYQFQDGVWHSQKPNPADSEYSFGIVYTDLAPKPGYVAYGAMTEQLEGATCQGRLDLGADDLYGFRFARDGQTIDVLWNYREKHETDLSWWPPEQFKEVSRRPAEPWQERWRSPVELRLPAAAEVRVTDLMGNGETAEAEAGRVLLRLTGSPIYVRGLGAIPVLPKVWPEMP